MYIFVLIVHVVVCFVLIFVVLLQAGRGGGFSDMMGGGQPQSLFGTQSNEFMARATEVCAVAFIITSLALGMMSTQKGKSLMEKERLKRSLMGGLPSSVTLPTKTLAVPPSKPSTAPQAAAQSSAGSVTPAAPVPAPVSPAGGKAAKGNAS